MQSSALRKLLIPLISLFVVSSIFQQAYSQPSGWYGGISLGTGDVNYQGYDDSDTFSLYLGNDISENAAIEFGYTDLGEFDVIGFPYSVEVSGYEISGLGKFPVSETVSLFGRLGVYLWDVEGKLFGLPVGEDSGTSITFGFGSDFYFNQAVGGRVAFQHYGDVSGGDITTLSLGVFTHF